MRTGSGPRVLGGSLIGSAHSGDLILFGAWDGEQVICFEEQVASHGGLGGPQDWPFLAFPPERRVLVRGIDNAEEVYSRLVRVYGTYG